MVDSLLIISTPNGFPRLRRPCNLSLTPLLKGRRGVEEDEERPALATIDAGLDLDCGRLWQACLGASSTNSSSSSQNLETPLQIPIKRGRPEGAAGVAPHNRVRVPRMGHSSCQYRLVRTGYDTTDALRCSMSHIAKGSSGSAPLVAPARPNQD